MRCHTATEELTVWSLLPSTLQDLQSNFNFEHNGKCFSILNHQSREHAGRKPRFPSALQVSIREAWLELPAACFLRGTSVAISSPPPPLTREQGSTPSQFTRCTLPTSASSFSAFFLVKYARPWSYQESFLLPKFSDCAA